MEALTLTTEQKATYVGIKATTLSGKPAKLYEDDGPIIGFTNGTATAEVSNVREYTDDNGNVGTEFDLTVFANGAVGASVVGTNPDGDADPGEVRAVPFEVNVTVIAAEAAGFVVPAPVIEQA
jgi:hypothetical protein